MNSFQRIYQLHRILASRRLPVSRKALEERLECSRATILRTIETLRNSFNAPLEYDRERNGYYYENRDGCAFELPGVWFDADELYALLTAQQLLEHIQPGLLDVQLKPIKDRLEKILAAQNLNNREIASRVRILSIMGRNKTVSHFQHVASALLQRQQLEIAYFSRSNGEQTNRTVSPQRLAHYRDNWYLDAWCHLRADLRSFAAETLLRVAVLPEAARDIADDTMETHYAAAYGIFAGIPTDRASLLFSAERARWVRSETWHPDQHGEDLPDGRYRLHVPYSDERELLMDIMRHGAHVLVEKPLALRRRLEDELDALARKYSGD